MGHSHYNYEFFDKELTRPLYGYVTEFKNGNVPTWVKKPKIDGHTIRELFDVEHDDYSEPIPIRKLPTRVKRLNRRHGPAEYEVQRETFLNKIREEGERRVVRFNLKKKERTLSGSRNPVPEEIRERLKKMRKTPKWDREIDGYHVSFSRWELAYHIGPRGGITDVFIEANVHH